MFTSIAKYEKDLIYLTNSLSIKFIDVAAAMNKGVMALGYNVPMDTREDRKQWKYFLNISGYKHFTNNDVKLTVIETGITESLSLELLETYPYTKAELYKQEKYYNDLVTAYPDDTLFIKGVMYPTDIDKAIDAVDGTILAYDKNRVEASEYTLLSNLENYIKRFLKRWNVRAYSLVDPLYLPSLIGVLYSNIPGQLTSIRVSNINTAEVHSFFLEHFFRSNCDLWEDIQILKPKTIYWLYRNLPYLQKHVGKEKTLEIILSKIFDDNLIGVGEYNLKIPDPLVNTRHVDDLTASYFIRQEAITVTTGMNKSFTADNIETNTLDEFITLEETALEEIIPVTDTEILEYDIDRVRSKLLLEQHDTVKTKAMTVGAIKLFDMNGVDILNLILDYWVHSVKNNLYNVMVDYSEPNTVLLDSATLVDYVDPNSNQYFTIPPKVGLLFLIKQLLYITGNHTLKLNEITYSNVLSTDKDRFDTIIKNSYHDGYSEKVLNTLREFLPLPMEPARNIDTFNKYLLDVIDYYKLTWVIDSNSENALVSMNIKNTLGKMLVTDSLLLTNDNGSYTIDELLAKNNIVYNITSNFDVYASISALVKAFTGLDIDPYLKIRNRLTCLTTILNKLTSYTVQVINPDVTNESVPVYYNNIQSIHAKNGLVTCLEADLTPLELEHVHIHAVANDYRDRFTGYSYSKNPRYGMCVKPIKGYATVVENNSEFTIDIGRPSLSVQVSDEVICDIKYIEYKDEFLLGVTAELSKLEDTTLLVKTDGSSVRDTVTGFSEVVKTADVLKGIDSTSGIGIVDSEPTGDFEIYIPRPTVYVDVSDDTVNNFNTMGIPQ